jgi:hypothetical protein
MKKKIVAILAIFLFSPAAFGGATTFSLGDPQGVSVTDVLDDGGNPTGKIIVEGTMSNVRYSADDVQAIGCRLRAVSRDEGDPRPTGLSALCTAVDIDGTNYSCFSADPAMIEVVQGISPYSFIRFKMELVFTSEGTPSLQFCEDLLVATRSQHIPDSTAEKSKTGK